MALDAMTILKTVFLRSDKMKIIVPIHVLATKVISNDHRSLDVTVIMKQQIIRLEIVISM